jgi:hypothetical protein
MEHFSDAAATARYPSTLTRPASSGEVMVQPGLRLGLGLGATGRPRRAGRLPTRGRPPTRGCLPPRGRLPPLGRSPPRGRLPLRSSGGGAAAARSGLADRHPHRPRRRRPADATAPHRARHLPGRDTSDDRAAPDTGPRELHPAPDTGHSDVAPPPGRACHQFVAGPATNRPLDLLLAETHDIAEPGSHEPGDHDLSHVRYLPAPK